MNIVMIKILMTRCHPVDESTLRNFLNKVDWFKYISGKHQTSMMTKMLLVMMTMSLGEVGEKELAVEVLQPNGNLMKT